MGGEWAEQLCIALHRHQFSAQPTRTLQRRVRVQAPVQAPYEIDGALWMSIAMLVVIWLELGAHELHVSEIQLVAVTAIVSFYSKI